MSFDWSVKTRAPPVVEAPGKSMMKLVPSELIVAWIELEAPVPTATMVMTQATPMMIPSMVSRERILLREIAIRPTLVMFHSRRAETFIAPPLRRPVRRRAPR